jgi:hypothetical protein
MGLLAGEDRRRTRKASMATRTRAILGPGPRSALARSGESWRRPSQPAGATGPARGVSANDRKPRVGDRKIEYSVAVYGGVILTRT